MQKDHEIRNNQFQIFICIYKILFCFLYLYIQNTEMCITNAVKML